MKGLHTIIIVFWLGNSFAQDTLSLHKPFSSNSLSFKNPTSAISFYGVPYYIKGAGSKDHFDLLVKSGANLRKFNWDKHYIVSEWGGEWSL